MGRKAIFLDRDGTLIVDKVYLNDPEQIEYLDGVFEGLALLRDEGFVFVVVTNQSGVPRGLVTLENLHEIHRRMEAKLNSKDLRVEEYLYAPYLVESDHPLRKPNPGMLLQGAQHHGIDLNRSWMVGDQITDVIAGQRAGTKTIWLHEPSSPKVQESPTKADFVTSHFLKAAEWIIK